MLDYKFENSDYTYRCYITRNGIIFYGEAKCHPDDYDMCSERTGYFIAETRANISMLRHIRDNEILPMVKYYRHFYDCISRSSKFNPDSYEAKRIKHEFKKFEHELKDIREEIELNRIYLKEYINTKDKVYKHIRMGRTN